MQNKFSFWGGGVENEPYDKKQLGNSKCQVKNKQG